MITLNIEKDTLGITVDFEDMLLIDKVQSESQFAGIAKVGNVILSGDMNTVNGQVQRCSQISYEITWTKRRLLFWQDTKENKKQSLVTPSHLLKRQVHVKVQI